jgi:hypothetical protein
MKVLRGLSAAGFPLLCLASLLWAQETASTTLLEDDFGGLALGMFSSGVIGAHAEYHYLAAVAPKGNWVVSAFRSEGSQRAWRVIVEEGRRLMFQSYQTSEDDRRYTHPMIAAGDSLWTDYTVNLDFAPESDGGQSGLLFRYRHDRAYYFFGVLGQNAVLKRVYRGAGFRVLDEKVLAQKPFAWKPGRFLKASVTVEGSRILAKLDSLVLESEDSTFVEGRIGLTSDVPTRFGAVRVTTTAEAKRLFERRRAEQNREEERLQAVNPAMVVWRKIQTPGFGVGRNLRFGDLNGDHRPDVLIAQVLHHGPRDQHSEVACLTAMTFEGQILWRNGEPDGWKDGLTNDVAVQIHDLDGDGRNEVVYCRDMELVVADGATGKTKYKTPTPETPKDGRPGANRFPRILGDSILFCDLRGTGQARDLILKDRYWRVWAFDERLTPLWNLACNTGHYPYAYDVDGDGRDELAIGYSLVDHDGKLLWTLDRRLKDHGDGVAIAQFKEGTLPRLLCAASDEGIFFADLQGRILKHHQLGHVQNPSIADFRPDLPGLEAVSINFWGNQGIVHFYDSEGEVYYEFEPCQHGSMMLPVNWTGRPGEYFVLSANSQEGGLFDGRGRRVLRFPADGHPDLCNAVLDVTGDCRDEIVVWDPYELWIYTQSDSPLPGRLYKPIRNPLHSYSNYQATVSLPGWSE